MKRPSLSFVLMILFPVFISNPAVLAAPIQYQGIIDNLNTRVSGEVDGFSWFDNNANGIDFWQINVNQPSGVSLDINGISATSDLDLAFSLYRGISTADESEFDALGDFGGLTFITSADDEVIINDPLGDPALKAFFLQPGLYTIALGGFDSSDFGPYGYDLQINSSSVSAIPLPPTLLLFLIPVASLLVTKRQTISAR